MHLIDLSGRMMEVTGHMSTAEQMQFMQRYPSLVRICFMEYSINAMMDWLPCERVLLFGSSSSCAGAMQTYSNIAVAMCDIFRQDAIITGMESWQALNASAAVGIERCIRVCKFKLFRAPEPIIRGPHMHPDSFVQRSMSVNGLGPDSMDLAMELFGGDRNKAASCMILHGNLRVFPLPECVALRQLESMDHMHSACSTRLRAAQHITFCSVCAINGKGFACKLRICCVTRKMSCITCPAGTHCFGQSFILPLCPDPLQCAGTVVTINMVGVLLKICSVYYYLCPSCTSLKVWAADGMDLCPWQLPMLMHDGSRNCNGSRCSCCSTPSSAAPLSASSSGPTHPHCAVCNSR